MFYSQLFPGCQQLFHQVHCPRFLEYHTSTSGRATLSISRHAVSISPPTWPALSDQSHSSAHSDKGLLYQFLSSLEKILIASESPGRDQCAKSSLTIIDWSHFVYFTVLFSMFVDRLLHMREPLPFLTYWCFFRGFRYLHASHAKRLFPPTTPPWGPELGDQVISCKWYLFLFDF